jgi:hypothetical protein
MTFKLITDHGLIDAEWRFDDGVRIHVRERSKHRYNTWREVEARNRVYVTANETFSVLEDLANRKRRPHHIWRPRVAEALSRIGIQFGYLSWSQKAGCSMCPCSPGFIVQGDDGNSPTHGFDFWVTLPDAPSVDERKPSREILFA